MQRDLQGGPTELGSTILLIRFFELRWQKSAPKIIHNADVSPCAEADDEVMYHNYYQWVSYLLFIQSLR